MNVGIATQNINAALFIYFIFWLHQNLNLHFTEEQVVFGHLVVVFLKIETTIKKSVFNTEFEPGSKNVSPEKSCTKITKQNKIKSQVIFIACCLLHTSDSACIYSIWHEARHSTQQRKHASVLSLWLCWVPPVGLPAKGLEASEYLYTVHTTHSTLPDPPSKKEGPPHPSFPSLVP